MRSGVGDVLVIGMWYKMEASGRWVGVGDMEYVMVEQMDVSSLVISILVEGSRVRFFDE